MSSLPLEPTYPPEELTDKRLATLQVCAESDHEYLSTLAQQKLREFGETIDVSAYDPDALYEEQQIRLRGRE